MDLIIVVYWFLAFSVIVLFLGTLNYLIGSPHSQPVLSGKSAQSDPSNQQSTQSNRPVTSSQRRKTVRNANKHRQRAAVTATRDNSNSNDDKSDDRQNDVLIFERKHDDEESLTESSVQPNQQEEDEFHDPLNSDETQSLPHRSPSPQKQSQTNAVVKQRHKCKNSASSNMSDNSSTLNTAISSPLSSSFVPPVLSKQDSIPLSKPFANVAPVKQALTTTINTNTESTQTSSTMVSKSNENALLVHDIYSHSGHNNVSSRVQEQEKDNEALTSSQFRRKKITGVQTKKAPRQLDPTASRQNDMEISASRQQINNKNSFESHLPSNNMKLSHSNGYSSDSDILSESVSTVLTNHNGSSLLSTSTDSPCSFKEFDMKHQLSSSNHLLDKLLSIFDTISFSSDELEVILKKLAAKHLLNKQNWQNLLMTKTKNDKSIEHLLEEKYYSQAKILAVELQIEKTRVLELTKTNVELDNTIRNLQQPNESMVSYQQAILSCQMQMRRLTDENARLAHQLHAYSTMPGTISELRQHQHILDEQLRQIASRNSSLEKEIADGDRARKHAAEIYKKADDQKQERMEQMMIDLNKYKKIEKDLSGLRQKHSELKESLTTKLNDTTHERDQLTKTCEHLEEKVRKCKEIKMKYDQLAQDDSEASDLEHLKRELDELTNRNELLQQRNTKIIEELEKHQQISANQSA